MTAERLLRFRLEAETIARLQHPNIVQVYEVGEQDDLAYLSMPWFEGNSLETRLARSPLTDNEAAGLLQVLSRAMHYAHQQGVMHRDLKPANVLFTRDGIPKITDLDWQNNAGSTVKTFTA